MRVEFEMEGAHALQAQYECPSLQLFARLIICLVDSTAQYEAVHGSIFRSRMSEEGSLE